MPTPDLAIAMRKITRQGSERIGRAAAAVAAGRRGRLTIVTKSNVLKVSDGLFRNAVQAAARDQAGLGIAEVLVDAIERKSVVEGKGVAVRVDPGGRRSINKKNQKT